jgi:hypothetical protein
MPEVMIGNDVSAHQRPLLTRRSSMISSMTDMYVKLIETQLQTTVPPLTELTDSGFECDMLLVNSLGSEIEINSTAEKP